MKRKQPLECIEDACTARAYVRGHCYKHNARLKRHGDVNTVLVDMSNRIYADTPTRFMAKVDKTESCWNWTAGRNKQGYGAFDRGLAHRWSYEHFVGPVPAGLVLDHLCRNRACVNPSHLEAVTSRVNILRGEGPPAQNGRRDYCKYGHKLAGDNVKLYVRPDTGKPTRVCVPCHRKDTRPWYPPGAPMQICVDDDGLVLLRGSLNNRSVALLSEHAWHCLRTNVRAGNLDHIGEVS
jgi:hypothetical protein